MSGLALACCVHCTQDFMGWNQLKDQEMFLECSSAHTHKHTPLSEDGNKLCGLCTNSSDHAAPGSQARGWLSGEDALQHRSDSLNATPGIHVVEGEN